MKRAAAGLIVGVVLGIGLAGAPPALAGPVQAWGTWVTNQLTQLRADVDAIQAAPDERVTRIRLSLQRVTNGVVEVYSDCRDTSVPGQRDYSGCCPAGFVAEANGVGSVGVVVICSTDVPRRVLYQDQMLLNGVEETANNCEIWSGLSADINGCCPLGFSAVGWSELGEHVCVEDI